MNYKPGVLDLTVRPRTIALSLGVGAIDAADDAWLITLAVLSGVAVFAGGGIRPRFHQVRAWVDPWYRDWAW